ncbi:thyrotropin-releasing hormone receptor isoform X1 [Anthonomus grandis grandis]|uniref:thyrotropin-releasing hormone receptor isoform X1 n=1 Tax=Anthonomus grandis grandis TaxID=2921223 RepID=UPI0021652736|nr:thyrotropin-releasing hormone receptor isoform X1 [Anthonomus grandis grandis]
MIAHVQALTTSLTLNVSAIVTDVNATTTTNYNSYTSVTPDILSNLSAGSYNNTNGSYNGSADFNLVFPGYIRTTSMVFCILIMCLGVIGNVMVPIVIFKTKDMRNSTNIFLVNLSVADLMVLLVCTPTVLVEVNTRPETWVLGREMCKAVPFVELTVAHASVLTILAISFERYYAICKPLKAGYICTKTRASLICLLAWFIAAVFTSPILSIAEYKLLDDDGTLVPACHTSANTIWSALYFLGSIFLFFIVPLVVLIVLYCIIAKNLIFNGTSFLVNKHIDSYSMRARKQVMLMLGTVVLSFFLCLIPFRIFIIYIIVVPAESLVNLSDFSYYNILFFCRIMVYLNSAINPILYNLMSSKFRTGFIICSATGRRSLWHKSSPNNHSSSRSSTFRTSHEGYRVCYKPKNCSVLIKASTDSSDTRSIDSEKDKEQICKSRGDVNIFTEKVVICHSNGNGRDGDDIGEEFLTKTNRQLEEETFV